MFIDIVTRLRNIIFVLLSAIIVAVLNCLLLTSLNTKQGYVELYENLNFDYTATSIVPYEDDDAYYIMDMPLYHKESDKLKLLDCRIFMEQEVSTKEKFYSNLILEESNSKDPHGVTITKSIKDRFGYKLNDKIYDIDNNQYNIGRIIQDIYHVFGDKTEDSAFVIMNYDKEMIENASEDYFAFCNYNQNVYAALHLKKNNDIKKLNKDIKANKIIYSSLFQFVIISYLIFCNYQLHFDKSLFKFGYSKFRILFNRILCNFLNFSIILCIGIFPLIFLDFTFLVYLVNISVSFLVINLINIINILLFKSGKLILNYEQ